MAIRNGRYHLLQLPPLPPSNLLPPLLPPPLQARAAGLVVNSMGWVEDLGYELLRHTITVRPFAS